MKQNEDRGLPARSPKRPPRFRLAPFRNPAQIFMAKVTLSNNFALPYIHKTKCEFSVPFFNPKLHAWGEDYTITLWFPCLDGLIQTRGNVARVKKSARNTSRRRVILPAFLNSSNIPKSLDQAIQTRKP